MTVLLEARGLGCRFGNVQALRNVDLTIRQGDILGLIGPNGAGKTTFFNAITGITPTTTGHTFWRGVDISRWSVERRAKLGIVRTFQHSRAFARLTVAENLAVACHRVRHVRNRDALSGVLREVGLSRVQHVPARELQYADARRLSIAIALAASPELLCLDEPAAGLGAEETGLLMHLIRGISQRGVTICLIEHDMRFVMGLSKHIVVLDAGQRIAEGNPGDIQRNQRVIEVYLGTGGMGGTHAVD